MIKILIIGKTSYIGNSFAAYLEKFPEGFKTAMESSRGEARSLTGLSQADCVLYCAGVAHRKAASRVHFQVNRDLAVATAEKAKQEGVRQFIYLSSAAVYGDFSGTITPSTPPNPVSAYGRSKLEAENELKRLQDETFTVTILRPPMVYGPGCRGNFKRLAHLARITPVFPDIENRRSMIYIENLCYFLRLVTERRLSGTYFPQNAEPVCTTELVRLIAERRNKKIRFTRLLNGLIYKLFWLPPLKKLFGSLEYDGTELERVSSTGFEEGVIKSLAD